MVLSQDDWAQIKAERESSGASFRDLAAKYGVTHQLIQRRAKNENWGDGQNVGDAVRRAVAAKLAGVVGSGNAKSKAEAVENRAETVLRVLVTHQTEWTDHRTRFGSTTVDFEEGKHAKINAEMLMIRQKGERLAHGLGADQIDPTAAPPPAIEVRFRD